MLKHFRPEFLNRIDNVVVFNPLSKENVSEIVTKELNTLSARLENDKNFFLTFDMKAKNKIIDEGYDSQFGARPIKRYIEKNIETLLAQKIISGEIEENIRYTITVENDDFELTKIRN